MLLLVVVTLGLISVVFLLVFSGTSATLVEEQSKEINKQIVFNYERYINSVIETANYLQLAISAVDLDTHADALQAIFDINSEIKRDLVSIFLFDYDGTRLLGNDLRTGLAPDIPRAQWFFTALDQPEIYHFYLEQSSNADFDGTESVITVSRRVSYSRNGTQLAGILLVELNMESITDLADKTNLGDAGHILIVNDQDSLVYTSDKTPYSDASFAIASRRYLGGFQARIHDLDMYVHINTLSQTRWRIVTISNIDHINTARRQMLYTFALIGTLSLTLTAMVAGLISLRISKPINQLKNIMAKIEGGDFYTTIEVSGQEEIVQLSRSFNQMVVRVRELMDRLVTEQREKRKTELRALQNQINPHFLYNTLDSIVWLAEHQRTKDVVTTVVALAKFFRISISKGESFIAVDQEIEHIENYLTIQQIRYIDKFDYSIDIDTEVLDHRVMKLILQPLVENAIHHGMGDEKGKISIRGRLEGDLTIFEVQNSGYGLTDQKIAEMMETMHGDAGHSGVGLRNVYQRLKLYYGDAADVEIESEIDESTTVRLIIPTAIPRGSERGAV
jgi:two-component system, sensor histidine kinase YesM